MEWNVKKDNKNIGKIELGKLILDIDLETLSFEDIKLSQELYSEMEKEIALEKEKISAELDEWNRENPNSKRANRRWSEKPVNIQYHMLGIELLEDQPNIYTISTGFEDAEDDILEGTAYIDVCLDEHEAELKMMIKKELDLLIDKFF